MNTIEQIQEVIAAKHGITVDEMLKRTRKRAFTEPRQISMYFCRKITGKSLYVIAEKHGNLDHATAIHAKKTIMNLMYKNKEFQEKIESIEEMLKEPTRKKVIRVPLVSRYKIQYKSKFLVKS